MNNKLYAKYLNVEHNFEFVLQIDSNYDDRHGYIRLTEPIEIEFTYLPKDNKKQIAYIDKKIEELKIDTESKLKELKEKRSKFLALPNSRDAGQRPDELRNLITSESGFLKEIDKIIRPD